MKFLIMCLADIEKCPRANRLITFLCSKNNAPDILSYSPSEYRSRKTFTIKKRAAEKISQKIVLVALTIISALIIRLIRDPYRIIYPIIGYRYGLTNIDEELWQRKYNWIIVEDLYLLPLAITNKKEAKVLFDAREYFPRQNENGYYFTYFESPIRDYLCRELMPKCDQVITVSKGLAEEYNRNYGIEIEVIRSVPYYREKPLRKTNNATIRMVHHGVANKNRSIEKQIDIIRRLDSRFTLDLYLNGSASYIKKLKDAAAGCDRIRFQEPVPFNHIIDMLSSYDIGFYYLEPNGFNVTYNLPNKLFEFIQARLAVAIGPSPEMMEIVTGYRCGFVSKEFTPESMVEELKKLDSSSIDVAKVRSSEASRELAFEIEIQKVVKIFGI